jgi:hypothetical protein
MNAMTHFLKAVLLALLIPLGASAAAVTPEEARKIAAEAYLYGFPVVDSYKTLYAQAVAKGGSDYKAPFNQIGNTANVFTPEDKAIITPNSDTRIPSCGWICARSQSC